MYENFLLFYFQPPEMKTETTRDISKNFWRQQAMIIARFVRDALEDLHSKGVVMDDNNMPDINRAIRS